MRNRLAVADDLESGAPEDSSELDREKPKNLKSHYFLVKSYIYGFCFETRHSNSGSSTKIVQNEIGSFRVIGVEIGWMSPVLQYLYCATGVMLFLVLYGVLQEHVVMNKFKRNLGWFVTFLQLGGYGVFAALLDSIVGSHKKEGKIPMYMYLILGILQVFMQGFTNLSMHYLNYPAKTMFKSSRVIMTMIFGVAFMGKSYRVIEYAVGACIVIGLTLFVVADAETSPEFSISGLVLILLALIADAAILNLQDYCLVRYQVTHDELIYYSFTIAAVGAFFMSFLSGELKDGVEFLGTSGTLQVFLLFVAFTLFGFMGMSCLAALTKRFGALKSAVTSTVRKGATLLVSYLIFPDGKSFTVLHFCGTAVFLSGLFLESTVKLRANAAVVNPNMLSEEDDEIGIITGDLNEVRLTHFEDAISANEDSGLPGNKELPFDPESQVPSSATIIQVISSSPKKAPLSSKGTSIGASTVANGVTSEVISPDFNSDSNQSTVSVVIPLS
jgi:adenosine 3'-phospho 5'-phosphosulfate transporter B3